MHMILVPALITLAVTLLRLVGELQDWSPTLFNRSAGGGGAVVGIVWLIPIFGIYFALKLAARGEGPASAGRALGMTALAFAANVAVTAGVFAVKMPFAVQALVFAASCWVCIVWALRAWPALGKTLLAYGLAARIPIAVIALVGMVGNWGTHYDVAPPGNPEVASMGLFARWFWIGLLPQMTAWIFLTVVAGMLFGSLAALLARRRAPGVS